MEKVTALMWKKMLRGAADEIINAKEYLTEVDMKIGDGDHGEGMERGFRSVKKYICESDDKEIDVISENVGISLIKVMGGASGVLFGTMFIGGMSCLPHAEEMMLKEMTAYFRQGEQAVEKRGKTKPGMKTMVDALDTACRRMEKKTENTCDVITVKDVIYAAYRGAEEGAEATAHMISERGRSKNFRERTIGVPDPGALSVSYFFKGMWKALKQEEEKYHG